MPTGPGLQDAAVQAFIEGLPKDVLDSAPQTHLPTQLPLAFPTPLHSINVITSLHLAHRVISHPRHAECLADLGAAADDLAVRGVLGFYLGSDEDWQSGNLLGLAAWKKGELGEAKVAEFFGVETMREKEHETMPGVRVGERWAPGIALVTDLVEMFQRIGNGSEARCVGEKVQELLNALSGQVADGSAFAQSFCQVAVELDPSLAEVDSPDNTVPLALLQDLAYRQEQSRDLQLNLPPRLELSDASPLPLPINVLLHFGLLSLNEGQAAASSETLPEGTSNGHANPFEALRAQPAIPPSTRRVVNVSPAELQRLHRDSIEACREIRNLARSQSDDWKRTMTMLDVARCCAQLDRTLRERGLNVIVTAS